MAYVNLGQVIYPIGAIFASTSSTSPSSMFGGTWSEIVGDSCLMACSGNVGVYGGSKNITIENMPPHNHAVGWYAVDGTFEIDHPVDCTHRGLQNGWTGIHTMPEGGGAALSALLLQMLYVETHCLAVRSELASQAKEKNSLIAVMLHA